MPKKKTIKRNSIEHIKCVWGLVCSMSSIDQQKNNVSLFNIIDQISAPKEIKKVALKNGDKNIDIKLEHEIVFLWRRSLAPQLCDTEVITDVKVSIIDPKGDKIGEILTPLKFESGKRIVRFRIQNNVLKINEEGDYLYRAEIIQPNSKKFVKAFEIPFYVQFV